MLRTAEHVRRAQHAAPLRRKIKRAGGTPALPRPTAASGCQNCGLPNALHLSATLFLRLLRGVRILAAALCEGFGMCLGSDLMQRRVLLPRICTVSNCTCNH